MFFHDHYVVRFQIMLVSPHSVTVLFIDPVGVWVWVMGLNKSRLPLWGSIFSESDGLVWNKLILFIFGRLQVSSKFLSQLGFQEIFKLCWLCHHTEAGVNPPIEEKLSWA